jgi:hypothetical protein
MNVKIEKEALLVPSTGACLKANAKETTPILRHRSFSAYVVSPETHYVKPKGQFPTQDAEGFFELLIPHDEDLTLDYLFEIR